MTLILITWTPFHQGGAEMGQGAGSKRWVPAGSPTMGILLLLDSTAHSPASTFMAGIPCELNKILIHRRGRHSLTTFGCLLGI